MVEHHSDGEQAALLNRLGRRGELTIVVTDGRFDVRLRRPSLPRSTDIHDLYEVLHLGFDDWHGEGPHLGGLLSDCEEQTRPPSYSVESLAWDIERRRSSRTHGPPLPHWRRWDGWHPGHERWLRCFAHSTEYLNAYLRDLMDEAKFEQERRDARAARRQRHQFATKAALT